MCVFALAEDGPHASIQWAADSPERVKACQLPKIKTQINCFSSPGMARNAPLQGFPRRCSRIAGMNSL